MLHEDRQNETRTHVAVMPGLHPRVMQERLRGESGSSRQLLEEARCRNACEYLRGSSIAGTGLALQIGFAERAVLSRSLKRWRGSSPRAWRKQHRA